MEELFSIEVFVRKLYSLDVECHLPSLSFRLLDYPTQTVHITEEKRIFKIQEKISHNPDSIRDLKKLKNSKDEIIFNKGKSCLFPLSFESAYSQLAEIPLYVVLADISGRTPKFLGSIGVSLLKMMDKLRDCIARDPSSICNDSIRGSYPIRNMMGSRVAKLAIEVKLFYYGTNLVHHIPALTNIVGSTHDSVLGKSEHLSSNQAISSVMQDIEHNNPSSNLFNKTSDLFSGEEEEEEEEESEFEKEDSTDLNPPPLFYQAVTRDKPRALPRDNHVAAVPGSPKRARTRSQDSGMSSDSRLDKFMKFSQANQPTNPELPDDYDPKRFDLIRAVLTELTYLTDYLDPNLIGQELQENGDSPRKGAPKTPKSSAKHPKSPSKQPQPPTTSKPERRTPKRYGLTNSYILRLSKLGPEKAMEVLTKHIGKHSANSVLDRYVESAEKSPVKPLVDRAAVRAATKPLLVSTECQTDQPPKVAWVDERARSRSRSRSRSSSSAPSSPSLVNAGTYTLPQEVVAATAPSFPPSPAHNPFTFPVDLTGTAPFFVPQEGQPTYSTPMQSTGSMSMAQVLAAMQALARPLTGMSQTQDTLRRANSSLEYHDPLRRANSNMEQYGYSDNFEEPSCISLAPSSPLSRPLSRAATSRLSTAPRTPGPLPEEEPMRRSTRNTRYEKHSSSLKSTSRDQDSSSTTSTALSTAYSPTPGRSRKSQTSSSSRLFSSSRQLQESQRGHSSASTASIACQTPIPARSHSTQTETRNSDSDDEDSTVLTVLQSPTRDLVSDGVSDHSSLKSGSIYIGSDLEIDSDDEEEDPLKLSYLLSTESVQFSDEDQPTSLLKLCSPSEARAHNRFMYTF